jgi:hypothetical protein
MHLVEDYRPAVSAPPYVGTIDKSTAAGRRQYYARSYGTIVKKASKAMYRMALSTVLCPCKDNITYTPIGGIMRPSISLEAPATCKHRPFSQFRALTSAERSIWRSVPRLDRHCSRLSRPGSPCISESAARMLSLTPTCDTHTGRRIV